MCMSQVPSPLAPAGRVGELPGNLRNRPLLLDTHVMCVQAQGLEHRRAPWQACFRYWFPPIATLVEGISLEASHAEQGEARQDAKSFAASVTSVTRRWRPQSRRPRHPRPSVRAGPDE